MSTPRHVTSAPRAPRTRLLQAGVLLGVGVAAFLDETLFHQILHWHHFYDRSSATVGLVSDGYFHAFGWAALVAGFFLVADAQRRGALSRHVLWAGGLLGWGGFQLYDGLVQHKLMHLHQIRYGVDLAPYDIAWNIAGALALAAGVVLVRRPRRVR